VDQSVLPEPVKLPHSRRVFKRVELERLFLDVDQQMARLGERFPLEKRSKLVAAYGEMRDKRDALLDQPARSAELEATARNFLKAIADTRRRLESP